AGCQALASLRGDFESTRDEYLDGWRRWQESLLPLDTGTKRPRDLYRVSTAALRTHEAKQFGGGIIASLSVPWGFAKSDDDIGGYHLVWPRDLVETAGALLAAGAHADARRVLYYLQVTQEADGHWPQNMWLDGESFWGGVQLDETAFPILLVDLARRSEALGADEVARLWRMVRRAAGFIVRNGPVTQQDRWEEDPGYSPFTLAVVIAALLVAADLADGNGEPRVAAYLQETADIWNASVERWTYVTGTELSRRVGVEGYYVRIAPPEAAQAASALYGFVPIKNRPPEHSEEPAAQIVSPDALALVRFGLRAAEDPRVLNTVRVIDALLEVNTPGGPAWHRYNGDGYGEHEDGAPFDGTGVGRASLRGLALQPQVSSDARGRDPAHRSPCAVGSALEHRRLGDGARQRDSGLRARGPPRGSTDRAAPGRRTDRLHFLLARGPPLGGNRLCRRHNLIPENARLWPRVGPQKRGRRL